MKVTDTKPVGIWHPYTIPIIGLAGEPDSGKTMWGLTASPDYLNFNISSPTLVWDTEGSSVSYEGAINFRRVDLPKLATFRKAGNYSNLDMFMIWRDEVKQLRANQYQVCMLDTISEIEDGLTTYVRLHPGEFGYTTGQFAKMESLVWTAVKAEWKRLLMSVAQKCQTLILTMHMMHEWKGRTTTNRRVPKGKETIKHVTSLYLTLFRTLKPGAKQLPAVPSGIYGKSRLVRINLKTKQPEPLLPPRIQDASPDGIRCYFKSPPDFNNLSAKERAIPKSALSDDDKLAVRAGIASDEAARAQADLTRVELEKEIKVDEVKKQPETVSFSLPVPIQDLRKNILSKMRTSEALSLLKTRYKVSKLSELSSTQVTDLEKHLATLKK